jgi:hypothetical protein
VIALLLEADVIDHDSHHRHPGLDKGFHRSFQGVLSGPHHTETPLTVKWAVAKFFPSVRCTVVEPRQ